jgi:hypothetical protein
MMDKSNKEKAKLYHIANPELQRAMHGLASSSAAEPQKDKRTKRARTRGAKLLRDLRDWRD